jgi:hypothetical protein
MRLEINSKIYSHLIEGLLFQNKLFMLKVAFLKEPKYGFLKELKVTFLKKLKVTFLKEFIKNSSLFIQTYLQQHKYFKLLINMMASILNI